MPVWRSPPKLVIASGGLSIPKLGASDFGYRLARQFGHAIVEPRPALVPLVFEAQGWAPFAALAGLSLEVGIETGSQHGRGHFVEDLLFTHRGPERSGGAADLELLAPRAGAGDRPCAVA